MAIFQFFKMAAVRHLGFSKVGNFNIRSHSDVQYASQQQILRRSVKHYRRYDRFFDFSRWRRSAIFDFQTFEISTSDAKITKAIRSRSKLEAKIRKLFLGGLNTRKTNPCWRTVAILNNKKRPYLRNGSSDRHDIWHFDAQWPSEQVQQLKFSILNIQDGGRLISATILPIGMTFGLLMHIGLSNRIGS